MKNAMTYKGYAARIDFDAEDRIFFELPIYRFAKRHFGTNIQKTSCHFGAIVIGRSYRIKSDLVIC